VLKMVIERWRGMRKFNYTYAHGRSLLGSQLMSRFGKVSTSKRPPGVRSSRVGTLLKRNSNDWQEEEALSSNNTDLPRFKK